MFDERPDRQELIEVLKKDPEAGADIILALWDRCRALQERVNALERNSRNSSKPPSSDIGKPKPKSQRQKSGKKRGGQPGHKGSNLELFEHPDRVVVNELEPGSRCQKCGAVLDINPPQPDHHHCEPEVRQVIDLPAIKLEVTEYRSSRLICQQCETINTAAFPEEVKARVQYGTNVRAAALYLGSYQMIPYQRLQELFTVLFDCSLSQGTLANFVKKGGAQAAVAAGEIHRQLKGSPLIHGDETGCRVEGQRHWLHVASTPSLTYFMVHAKRGFEALAEMAILPNYCGDVVHDFYQSYYRFEDCRHFQCNAHILRELTYLHEEMSQAWAKDMKELLLEAKQLRDRENARSPDSRRVIGEKTRQRISARYVEIILEGYSVNPEPEPIPGKRGKPKRGKALNLLDRFDNRYEEIMGFFEYENIPFDNNLAERDLRMMKTHEKISGTFRSANHAIAFTDIRSVISTLKKRGRSVLAGISDMLKAPENLFGS